jgi:hypothetical protein
VRSSTKKIPTKAAREASTTWQAVNSVGKPLPPAKGISMSLRYARTAWRAFNSVGSLAAARQPRRGPKTAAAEAEILIANARLKFRANH